MTPAELDAAYYGLSLRQQRCVATLLALDPPPTYRQVAEELAVHVGTVHTLLCRVRRRNPRFYAEVMAERRRQLAAYHELVVEARRLRSLRWGRRRFAARYRAEHGRWPWEDYAEKVMRTR